MLIKKNLVILHPCDKGACAFYRCHAIAMNESIDLCKRKFYKIYLALRV